MKSLLIVLLTAFTFNVMANDAAAPRISVKGVDPMGTPSGTSFKVYGGNTKDFFEMIPGIMSVTPQEDVERNKAYRTLNLESNGWILNISCLKGSEAKDGAECNFELNKIGQHFSNHEGDTYDWAPSCSGTN